MKHQALPKQFMPVLFVLASILVPGMHAAPVGTAFSFQGSLSQQGVPSTGAFDMRFKLFDAATAGNQVGADVEATDVAVVNGVFTVALDFGEAAFTGEARWLEIAVAPAGRRDYTLLQPRQRIYPTPYALFAKKTDQSASTEVDIFGKTYEGSGTQFGLTINNKAPTGPSAAVVGTVLAPQDDSAGIMGLAQSTTGKVVGVWGETGSTTDGAVGIKGLAVGTSGATAGVYGSTASTDFWAAGVKGLAKAESGYTFGVIGENMSHRDGSAGVWGLAKAATGATIGVHGVSESSSDGASGVKGGTNESSGRTFGVVGESMGAGDGSAGVKGVAETGNLETTAYGVYGSAKTAGNGTAGVMGVAEQTSGKTFGVYGETKSTADGAAGVKGVGRIGVLAEGGNVAVKATSNSGNLFEGYGNGGARRFAVENDGTVRAAAYNTYAADFAEMLPAEDGLEPGDVLAVADDGRVVRATAERAAAVVGVVSTQPGFVGGSRGDNGGKVPVAVMGVVPVKVTNENGPVRPNDLLAVSPSRPGYAARAVPLFTLENGQAVYGGGTIIGRALSGMTAATGTIKVLIR